MPLQRLYDPMLGSPREVGMLVRLPHRTSVARRGAMELIEAFEAIIGGATGLPANRAVERIRECALGFARADSRCDRALADDCAQVVVTKLWTRLATGVNPVRRPSSDACAAYIRSMVTNWLTDRAKSEARQREKRESIRQEASSSLPASDEALARSEAEPRSAWLRALLERVAAHAIASRQPHQREHLERGWAELRTLVFDEAPLAVLLVRSGALAPQHTRVELATARNAAYKRHERARAALMSAIADMESAGALTSEEATAAELAIRGLVRRNRGEPPQEDV